MRRISQFTMVCLAAGVVVTACRPEEVIITEDIPTAGVRFIHAVPDTGAMDMRPVDIVENSTFYNVTFRSTTLMFYKNARAGARHFRIFRSDTTAAVASTVVWDTTYTLEAGHRYTFILWGYSRPGSSPAMKLDIIDDNPADPGTGVALRLVNAASGLGALDGKQYPATSTAPGTPTWANVATLSASAYVAAPVGSIKFNVTPAGGGAALFTDPTALAGTPATVLLDATPGTTVPGSAVSAFVFSGSVIGSQATAFVSTTLATDSISVSAVGFGRTAGSFVTQGFIVGDTVTTSGFTDPANNGNFVVTAVTATLLTVTKVGGGTLVVEAKRPQRIVRTPRPGVIFLWDRRPPRAPGF